MDAGMKHKSPVQSGDIQIRSIDLEGKVASGAGIEFLRAELPMNYPTPFVLVRYKEDGVEQKYGLRLDMDKGVFVDHFNDKAKERVLKEAVSAILAILVATLGIARLF